jgi:hypothetical protein
MNTIDGLTLEEVKYNIYAFGKEAKEFARRRDAARYDHTRAKWQKKYAQAAGWLADNQERLARFEAIEHVNAPDGCQHKNRFIMPGSGAVFCRDCDAKI